MEDPHNPDNSDELLSLLHEKNHSEIRLKQFVAAANELLKTAQTLLNVQPNSPHTITSTIQRNSSINPHHMNSSQYVIHTGISEHFEGSTHNDLQHATLMDLSAAAIKAKGWSAAEEGDIEELDLQFDGVIANSTDVEGAVETWYNTSWPVQWMDEEAKVRKIRCKRTKHSEERTRRTDNT